jgi:hypothetical protein
MLRNSLKAIAFISLVLSLLYGCKKEKDTQPPVVNISSPYDNQPFAVYDTMTIIAEVKDEARLEWITIELVNDQMIPVQQTVDIEPTALQTNISRPYIIYDMHLQSGTYYVRIKAFDGFNESSSYKQISITAAPVERKGFYILSKNAPTVTSVYYMDESFSIVPKLTLNGDLSNSAINSYYQDIYVAGQYSGNVSGIDLESHSVKWSIPAIQSSSPYFTNIYNDGSYSYVSFYGGSVKAYDQNGVQRSTAVSAQNYYPVKTLRHADYLVTEQRDISSASKKIVLYYANNGTGYQETVLTQEVVAFYTKDPDNIFTFGNSNGQAVMEIYQLSTNGFWEPHTLPAGRLLSVAQVDGNTYLLGHENNTVYKYQYSNNSLTTWLGSVKATDIFYDPVNNEVVIAGDKKISTYGYVSAGQIATTTHTDTILDMQVLYNK